MKYFYSHMHCILLIFSIFYNLLKSQNNCFALFYFLYIRIYNLNAAIGIGMCLCM